MAAILFGCMRDEGPWALEWVAYHRLIGFDRIVVYTNDCSDGTETLLDALAPYGVERRDNRVPEGVSAQIHAAARAAEHPVAEDGDWVMWLDTDEFLNVHLGDGRLADLTARLEATDGYAVHWRLFGDSGQTRWTPAPVIARFDGAARTRHDLHEPVKTLFRWGPSIEALSPHRPVLRPSFRERGLGWLHGPGAPVPEVFYYFRINRDAMPALRLPYVTGQFAWAQVNHYAVRSAEEYAVKRRRGSGIYRDRHDDEYWTLYNRNDQSDRTIRRHLPALTAELARLRADPAVASAEASALDPIRTLRAGKTG